MDEGKLPPDLFSLSEKSSSDGDEESGEAGRETTTPAPFGSGSIDFGGRLGGDASSGVDLASNLPDEDEAVAAVASRFRSSAPRDEATPSLDATEEGDDDELADDMLADFVLDALDSPPEATAPPAETKRSEEGQTDRLDEPLSETQRLDGDAVQDRAEQPSAPPPEPTVHNREESKQSGIICPHCHAPNPASMRFCVQCGGALKPSSKKAKPAAQSARVSIKPRKEPPPPTEAAREANPWEIFLVSINEDGSDGVAIPLEYLETTMGRDGDTRFPTDAFLSPKHARLHIEGGDLFIEDLYSLNGTFLKLRDEVKLTPGDTFLMGRQVLRFERFEQSISPKTKSSDGTRYMGSPAPGGNYKILQIGIGGVVQNVYCLPEAGAVLGREKGDIIFPHDKFMSSRHAQIYTGDDGSCYLVDLTSSNGTWIKIWEKTELQTGDFIFMGQQLFRVHIKDKKRTS